MFLFSFFFRESGIGNRESGIGNREKIRKHSAISYQPSAIS
ncbi:MULTISPECIES: hypothetical protein [Moorena]|nr:MULTISPECIES: hypothetical protein [Moorena]